MLWYICIAAVGLLVLFFIADVLYKRTNHYKNQTWQAERFQRIPDGIEIAAIGSGPGLYDVDLKNGVEHGFNFCQSPQSWMYGYRILRAYQKKLKPYCIIIIITCPLNFAEKKSTASAKYHVQYYGSLPPEDIDMYSRWRDILRHFPLIRHLKWGFRIIKDIPLFDLDHNEKRLESAEAEKSARELLNDWLEQSGLHDLRDPSQSEQQREAMEKRKGWLRQALDLCEENRWRPVFVIPPMCGEVCDMVSAEFKEEFVLRPLREVSGGKYQILDYFNEDEFQSNDLYYSAPFMNRYGREKFTKRLLADVREIYVDNMKG